MELARATKRSGVQAGPPDCARGRPTAGQLSPPGGRAGLLSLHRLLGGYLQALLQGHPHKVPGHSPVAAGWLQGPGMSSAGTRAARPVGPHRRPARRLAGLRQACAGALAWQSMMLGCVRVLRSALQVAALPAAAPRDTAGHGVAAVPDAPHVGGAALVAAAAGLRGCAGLTGHVAGLWMSAGECSAGGCAARRSLL